MLAKATDKFGSYAEGCWFSIVSAHIAFGAAIVVVATTVMAFCGASVSYADRGDASVCLQQGSLATSDIADNSSSADQEVCSIEFKPCEPVVVSYGEDDPYSPCSVWRTDALGRGYYYYEGVSVGNVGDALTVTYADGETVEYVCSTVKTGGNSSIRAYVAAGHDQIALDSVFCFDDQEKNHWDVGKENYLTVSYAGKSCDVRVFVKHYIGAARITYRNTRTAAYQWFTWNGVVKPRVSVVYDGKTLREGKDYTVEYSGNKGISRAGMVSVHGKGNSFYGDWPADSPDAIGGLFFGIRPKGTSVTGLKSARNSVTVTWKKQAMKMPKKRIAGYEVQIAGNRGFKHAKKIAVRGFGKTSKKIAKLNRGKKYYVRVRTYYVTNAHNSYKRVYSTWSNVRHVRTRA